MIGWNTARDMGAEELAGDTVTLVGAGVDWLLLRDPRGVSWARKFPSRSAKDRWMARITD